jgi:hypothetical protein
MMIDDCFLRYEFYRFYEGVYILNLQILILKPVTMKPKISISSHNEGVYMS